MYRPLGPNDAAAVVRHYLALCPRDRSLRFGVAQSDEAVIRYCAAIDWRRARLAGYFARHRLRGLIELSAPLCSDAHAREVAIIVAPAWRRRGVGRRLVRIAGEIARAEACERLLFCWDRGNAAFALFLASCGGAIERDGASGRIDLSPPLHGKAAAQDAAFVYSLANALRVL